MLNTISIGVRAFQVRSHKELGRRWEGMQNKRELK